MPKTGIHPHYFPNATYTCSCGASYTIGATIEQVKLDICRTCHPFYTGTQKLVDTAGRVDRFRAKQALAQSRSRRPSAKNRPATAPDSAPSQDSDAVKGEETA